MYTVVFPRDYHTVETDHTQVAEGRSFSTLEGAAVNRCASGDIVLFNGRVVLSQKWLWDWEKADPNSFAQKVLSHYTKVRRQEWQ